MPVPESLVKCQVESLQLLPGAAEPHDGVQMQITGHEQRREADLREVG